MNIFVLDSNVILCAQYHNDKHVIKMILETAQLLCSAHWVNGTEAPYKKTHVNHPCSIWVRESISNYKWLCNLGKELCKEYTYRRGRRHKTEDVIHWLIVNLPNIKDIGLTPFAQAMPDYLRDNNSVIAYRQYYILEKQHLANWSERSKPYWYNSAISKKYIYINNQYIY